MKKNAFQNLSEKLNSVNIFSKEFKEEVLALVSCAMEEAYLKGRQEEAARDARKKLSKA